MTSGVGPPPADVAFVVLAGGGSRRMGRDKAFLAVGGREMLDRLLEVGRAVSRRCVLAVGDRPGRFIEALHRYGWRETSDGGGEHRTDAVPPARIGGGDPPEADGGRILRRGDTWLRVATDRRRGRGPLAGLETGLGAARAPLCFVAACDLPFLGPDVVRAVLRELGALTGGSTPGGRFAVVPDVAGRLQPLAAAYQPGCARVAHRCLEEDELSVESFLGRLTTVRTAGPEALLRETALAPEHVFMNVNAPADLRSARRIAGRE